MDFLKESFDKDKWDNLNDDDQYDKFGNNTWLRTDDPHDDEYTPNL